MTTEPTEFGARLSAERRRAGLSQQELAERSGLSIRAISNLERGRTGWPHLDSVRRLADALGLREGAREEFIGAAGRRLAGAAASPVTTAPDAQPAQAGRTPVVPRQLPGPVRQFTGRRHELAALTGLLGTNGSAPSGLVISAIGGMAGVGKTALAVHWAHQVAAQFPDGQLYVDLRGYDPSGRPIPAGDALAGFLRGLGLAGPDIPSGTGDRAAAYRSLLAGRRVLVVLDNAGSADQVRPLLPGNPGCVTVVTSRNALAGLVAGDGAVRVRVDLLPLPEAAGLLRELIGSRAEDDPAASIRLADQCGRLPLTLRVAAELAVTRPSVQLADLTAELADLQHRLDVLETGGDERTTVRAVFSWSYQNLSPAAARMFRLAGMHVGPDISVPAAASLAAIPSARARQALGELARAHLLHEHSPGRFSCHDLLRAYAAEQAAAHHSPAQRHAAVHRVLDHYLHSAYAADRLLHPSRNPVALLAPTRGTQPETPADPEQAMAWFDAEHKVLLAAVAHAAGSGFSRHAWQLPWSLATFFSLRAHYEDLAGTQRTALDAATSLGDVAAQALAHDRAGFACLLRGQHQAAAAHFDQALDLFREIGDQVGEACTYLNVSFLLERQGQHAEAVRHDERALSLFQAVGRRAGQAAALNAAGWHLALLGDHQQALTRCQQALALQRELEDRLDEANTWDSLGYIHDQLGQHGQAAHCYRQALRLLGRTKERWRQATVLTHLGDARLHAGERQAARDAWRQALTILDAMHHPDAEHLRVKLTIGNGHPLRIPQAPR